MWKKKGEKNLYIVPSPPLSPPLQHIPFQPLSLSPRVSPPLMFQDDGFRSNILAQVRRYSHIARDLTDSEAPPQTLPPALPQSLPQQPTPLPPQVPQPQHAALVQAQHAAQMPQYSVHGRGAGGRASPTPPPLPGVTAVPEVRVVQSDAILMRLDAFELQANAFDYNVMRRKRTAELMSDVKTLQHEVAAENSILEDEVLQAKNLAQLKAGLKEKFLTQLEGTHTGLREVTAYFHEKQLQVVRAMHSASHEPLQRSSSPLTTQDCPLCNDTPGEDENHAFDLLHNELEGINQRIHLVRAEQESYVDSLHAELRNIHLQIESTKEARKRSEEEFVVLLERVVGKLADELKEEKQKRVSLFKMLRTEMRRRNLAKRTKNRGNIEVQKQSAHHAKPIRQKRAGSPPKQFVVAEVVGAGGMTSPPPAMAEPAQPLWAERETMPAVHQAPDLSPTPTTLRMAPSSLFTHLFQPHPATPVKSIRGPGLSSLNANVNLKNQHAIVQKRTPSGKLQPHNKEDSKPKWK